MVAGEVTIARGEVGRAINELGCNVQVLTETPTTGAAAAGDPGVTRFSAKRWQMPLTQKIYSLLYSYLV